MKYRVVYYIESDGFGGAEQSMFNLFRALDKNTLEPILLYHPHSGIAPFVDRVKGLEIPTISVPKITGLVDISGFKVMVKKLKELQPIIFHAHLVTNLRCSFGIISASLAGVNAILATQHSYQKKGANNFFKKYKYLIYQKTISIFVDRYIAVSCQQAKHLKRSVISQDKVEVVPNGVDVKDFSVSTNKTFLKSISNEIEGKSIILTVARLDNLKGHKYLIEAVTMVPGAVFLIAGDGPERANFEEQARKLGVAQRIIFLGQRNDIPDLLNICDLFVLPSLLEGLPLSILEAMAASKPVIATDIEGINEIIIDGQNGLFVPPANAHALADKINILLSDKSLAQRLSENGRESVTQKFSVQKMTEEVISIYEEMLLRKGINRI